MVNPIEQGYITVAERHAAFVEKFPTGAVVNEVSAVIFDPTYKTGLVVMKSSVWKLRTTLVKGEPPDGIGHASMPVPGPTNFTRNSEIENAETSALGRALAMIGFHAKETMASADEIKSKSIEDTDEAVATEKGEATAAQKRKMFKMARDAGIDVATADGKAILAAIVMAATGKRSSKQLLKADMDAVFTALDQSKQEYEAAGAQAVSDNEPLPHGGF